MAGLPASLVIALCMVGSLWAVALVGYAFGVSGELVFSVFIFGLVAAATEWWVRRKSG